jgi:hypothetical protein
MKVVKTASGKQTIKLSKKEWQNIGKKAGWMKKASSTRERVMFSLKELLGENSLVKPSEEFDSTSKGGIWFSNEGRGIDGLPIYDSYGETEGFSGGYPYEFHPKLQHLMERHGWFIEPYDSGTLMAFPQ